VQCPLLLRMAIMLLYIYLPEQYFLF